MKRMVIFICILVIAAGFSHATSENKKPSSYSELVSWYMQLEENYPDYMEVFPANELYGLGKVDGGYDLYYVRITNESNGLLKPEVLFLGGPHGDETAGTIGLYWTAKWLLGNKDENEWVKWLLDHREIYIEISHNPYGFDHRQRWDANEWDLNREADYDWRGYNSELWGSVNGKTLYHFINDHAIRVGTDFHGGVRMLLYPWSSTHADVKGKSPFSNKVYSYAPPDFHFYHTACLRLGDYMGDFGGDLNEDNIGTIPTTVGYPAPGCLAAWAYGGNVKRARAEDEFVNDELYGNYDGCGIFWVSPEISTIKDPPEWKFGDYERGYIAEILRYVIHQTDIAQPYILWSYPENNSCVAGSVKVKWQVYGCLNVDETYVMYTFSDNLTDWVMGEVHDEYNGGYRGGTYWDGKVWEESIDVPEGVRDVYVRAYARVDGIYSSILAPEIYGTSYLRIVQERTNESYLEVLNTSDGVEVIKGHIWWSSPLLHIRVGGILLPEKGGVYVMGKEVMRLDTEKAIILGRMNMTVEGEYSKVEFYVDGNMAYEDDSPPYIFPLSGIGRHTVTARMYYDGGIVEDNREIIIFAI